MMKKLLADIILVTAIGLPVNAQQEHQHGQQDGNQMGGAQMGMMGQACMMGSECMMAMHEHMNAMQETMSQIHAESDPTKRQALMDQHRATMHETMGMMMKHDGAMAGDEKMSQMSMDDRMQMMEERMRMTRMMMSQMMERNAELETHGE